MKSVEVPEDSMNKQKNVSLAIVIINCIVAVLWNIGACIDLAHGYHNAFRIIITVLWDLIAATWIVRYMKSKKKDN